jgi:L-2-hydroxyglutarate oxidase LhgO
MPHDRVHITRKFVVFISIITRLAMATTVAAAASKVEVVVIGAGVVGIAVARALSEGREVLLLDRADQIGSETSARNSEVVHAGLYYPRDSYKAQFCVRGRQLLYRFCEARAVNVKRCGKLVVATDCLSSSRTKLEALHRQAIENGVSDVKLISPEQVRDMEPDVSASGGALWSPSTGVVDSHIFMANLLSDAQDNGSTLVLQCNVDDARIIHNENAQQCVQLLVADMWLTCSIVVNCAGLWVDEMARKIHRHHRWQPPMQW